MICQKIQEGRKTAGRCRAGAWFGRKKKWAKLNACAIIGIGAGVASAYAVPWLAQKAGLDSAQAATWVASTSQYVVGTGAMFTASWVMTRNEFGDDTRGLLVHNLKIVGKSTLAGILAMAAMWASSAAALLCGVAESLAITISLAANYATYLALFNLFNRRRLRTGGAD